MVVAAANKVPKPILDIFWPLAEYNEKRRKVAAQKLITEILKDASSLDYCLKRLIQGLASARQNARLGFAVALTELLRHVESITCEDVLRVMDSTLSENEDKPNVCYIGRALCLTAIVRSKKCLSSLEVVVERITSFPSKPPFVGNLRSQAMISLVQMVDDYDQFKSVVWPHFKPICQVSLNDCTADILWLLLELDSCHTKLARKKIKLFREGWLTNDEQFRRLKELLAETRVASPALMDNLISSLVANVVSNDLVSIFWEKVVCENILADSAKTTSLIGLKMIETILPKLSDKNHIKTVLSRATMRCLLKFLVDRLPISRMVRETALEQVGNIVKFIRENKNAGLIALKSIFDVSANFDSLGGTNMTQEIFRTLTEESSAVAIKLLLKIATKPEQTTETVVGVIRHLHKLFLTARTYEDQQSRIVSFFTDCLFVKEAAVEQSVDLSTETTMAALKTTFTKILESFCIVTKRGKAELFGNGMALLEDAIKKVVRSKGKLDENFKLELEDEKLQLIKNAGKVFFHLRKLSSEKLANVEAAKVKGFTILIGYMILWSLLDDSFDSMLEEMLICSDKAIAADTESKNGIRWIDVLVDWMLSTCSCQQTYIRLPIQVAFCTLEPCLPVDSIKRMLEVLKPSDTSIFDIKNTSDDESDITDDEMDENENIEATSTSDGSSSDDNNDDDVKRLTANGDIDPNFKKALKDALGDAAMQTDTESNASDLSDETMLQLDKTLAKVFKTHLLQPKRDERDISRQADSFRMRCFDLVFALITTSTKAELLTELIVPLLKLSAEAGKKADQGQIFNRSRMAVDRIVHSKEACLSPGTEESYLAKATDVIKSCVDLTKTWANPAIHMLVADSVAFLLKLANKTENAKTKEAFNSRLVELFTGYVEQFFMNRASLIPMDVIAVVFRERTKEFAHMLPVLLEYSLNEEVRPYRRYEAFCLCRYLLNKEMLTTDHKRLKSEWKRFTDHLADAVVQTLNQPNQRGKQSQADKALSNKNSARPRHFFELLNILSITADLHDVMPLRRLESSEFVEMLIEYRSKHRQSLQRMSEQLRLKRHGVVLKLFNQVVTKLQKKKATEETVASEEPKMKKPKLNHV